MDTDLKLIVGGSHSDDRGTIVFINDFDMSTVKRFYRIKHQDTETIRGWRAHRIEQRWFHVSQGSFEVRLIEIDNWNIPSQSLPQKKFVLKAAENAVLHIPAGYASAIQAKVAGSELTVFADYDIDHAKNDDYLYPITYFNA
ncbi:MAG: sugar epimerase [Flavobacterium sp.]|nr:MAG: sugar epimerase [Flavobacterium sp.]